MSEHFKAWENLGMPMGKMYEVALTVEGYQSSGSANVYSNTLTIGGNSGGGDGGAPTARVEAENMTKGGQYTSNISSPPLILHLEHYESNESRNRYLRFLKYNHLRLF